LSVRIGTPLPIKKHLFCSPNVFKQAIIIVGQKNSDKRKINPEFKFVWMVDIFVDVEKIEDETKGKEGIAMVLNDICI
jgi:hypothetical protein